jgi:hypothetical protein
MREEGAAENLASAIYGTILSTALIAAYSEDPGSDPLQVAVAVVVTSLVFWIAHAYAGVLARGAEPGHGMAIAWRRGRGLAGMAIGAGASGLFGLVVVGLKALVH